MYQTLRLLVLSYSWCRDSNIDQKARQNRKSHKEKPHTPLSAAPSTQVIKLSTALNRPSDAIDRHEKFPIQASIIKEKWEFSPLSERDPNPSTGILS